MQREAWQVLVRARKVISYRIDLLVSALAQHDLAVSRAPHSNMQRMKWLTTFSFYMLATILMRIGLHNLIPGITEELQASHILKSTINITAFFNPCLWSCF